IRYPTACAMKRKGLVVGIGGTHVKLLMSGRDILKFDSGPKMRSRDFVSKFHETVAELKFASVCIGFPAVVCEGKIVEVPKHLGEKAWREEVLYCMRQLKLSFVADTVVLGGGNVKKMNRLPRGVKKGDNRNALLGGCRLWETDRKTGEPRWQIL